MQFLARRKAHTLSRTPYTDIPQLTLAYANYRTPSAGTRSGYEQTAYYYVFNADNSGHVIVAGDDRACPILAYSDEGIFVPEALPANCIAWLNGYEEELKHLPETENIATPTAKNTVVYPTDAIAPLMSSMWGQNAPYNDLCPQDKNSEENTHTLTGCVATAIAQIMYYHRWPEQPTGTISYTDTKQGEVRSINFNTEASFEWNKMQTSYTDDTPADQRNAVAHLMKCAGYGAKMKYGAEASITYQRTGAEALYKYFGYDRNIHRYERKQTGEQKWVDILVGELQAGRPILYDGRNPSMGHTFVCDGYDGNEAFHFNWGWNGSGNGFYRLSALKPSTQAPFNYNDSYTFSQAIECHIQPAGKESVPQKDVLSMKRMYSAGSDNVHRDENTPLCVNRQQSVSVGCSYLNNSHTDFIGQLCAAIHIDGRFTPVTAWVETVSTAGVTLPVSTTMPLTNTASLPEGTYELTFWYRWNSDTEPVRLSAGNNGVDRFRMTVTTDELGLYPIHPYFHLTQSQPLQAVPLYTNQTKTWTLSLYNDGDVRLEGYVGICLYKADEGISNGLFFKSLAYCESGKEVTIAIQGDLTGIKRGSYLLMPFYCTDNSITATVTSGNIAALDEPITVDVTLTPMVTIQMQNEAYVLDKRTGKMSVVVSQPSALIPWTGRICGKVFKAANGEKDREDTGVVLYSKEMELLKPAVVPCELTGFADGLSTEEAYEITFYLDNDYGLPLYTQALSVTDTDTGIAAPKTACPVRIDLEKDGKQLRIVTYSVLKQIIIYDMTGRKLTAKQVQDTRETTCTLPDTPHGPLLIQIQTEDGVTVTKFMSSNR